MPAVADCTGDVDGDGSVTGADLAAVLSDWGGSTSDISGDGLVDGEDLAAILGAWGPCPSVSDLLLVTPLDGLQTIAMDAEGNTVKSWLGAGVGASVGWLWPDGSLVRPSQVTDGSFNSGGRGGRIEIFAPDGTLTNTLILATTLMQQHHDVHPMPNGNILCITWEWHSVAEALGAGRTTLSASSFWSETILEIRPTSATTWETVWQWRLWDHLIQDSDAAKPGFGVVAEHPELCDINFGTVSSVGDWIHMNAIDYSPERDEILVSSRSLDELWVIDHSTSTAEAASHAGGTHGKGGDFLYRWGNPQGYDRGTAAHRQFFVVHGATWIDSGLPGAGNILAFNNGDRAGSANDWSQVVEIAPPRNADGSYVVPASAAFGPAAPSFTIGTAGEFFGGPTQCGAFRTLDNTTLVTLTLTRQLLEFDSNGNQMSARTLTGQIARVPRYRLIDGEWAGR